jgi:hypothetical protein
MGLELPNKNYIKIKDNSITATGLEYYIDLQNVPSLPNESTDDSLKTYAYGIMKDAVMKKFEPVEYKPFEGAKDL